MSDNPQSTTEFLCYRGGLVVRGGDNVGLLKRLPNEGWHWRTSTMEHTGVARTKRAALAELVAAWRAEGV